MDLLEIIPSRGKAEVFRLLFDLGKPELHLRELARRTSLSLATVQQEVRNLTASRLLTTRRDGNRLYYRANPAHPLHGTIQELVLKTTGIAGAMAEPLNDPAIQIAFIFGSIPRGEVKPESDIDLMVIGELGLRRLTTLLSGLSNRLGREINPHALTPLEFATRRRKREHFVISLLTSPKLFIKGSEDELESMGE